MIDQSEREEIDRLIQYLGDRFPSTKVVDYFGALSKTTDGLRLLSSICVDLCSGAIRSQQLLDVIEKAIQNGGDPLRSFNLALNSLDSKKTCAASNLSGSKDHLCDAYVRVMTLASYIEHVLHKTTNFTIADIDLVRSHLVDNQGWSLDDLEFFWSGKRPIVWVGEAEVLIDNAVFPSNSGAQSLNDRLGLNFNSKRRNTGIDELVYVVYPKNYKGFEFKQPCVFDASWIYGGYYLSYGMKDNWGRTCLCSSGIEGQKERVHYSSQNVGNGFRAYYLGKVSKLETDRDGFKNEALRRSSEWVK